MSTSIHMLYLIKRKEAWYQLTDEEKAQVSAQTVEATRQAGGTRLILCDSTWSTSEHEFFELTEFPTRGATQKRIELYERVELFRYYEIRTILGTEMD